VTVTILIVDDNNEIRRTIKALLANLSGQIHECGDGAAALAAYHEHRPDWVLMDIEMKPVDGITATRQIMSADPRAKVVMVTNYAEAELREAAKSAGAVAYVLKDNLVELLPLLQGR
jgi:CheY-like chemotaxis protein